MFFNTVIFYGMRLLLIAVLFGLVGTAQGRTVAQSTDVIAVIDTSGSMEGRINGVFKLHIATDAITRLATHLPEPRRIGAIAYGENSRRCDQVTTLLPLQSHSPDHLNRAFSQLRASGPSALTAALRAALLSIENRNQPTTLVLVVDGVDSCGRDTCALIRSALNQGLDFSVHIIGLRLNNEAQSELRCVAETSDGELHNIRNINELDFALGNILFAALSTTTPIVAMNGQETQTGSLRTPELITTTPGGSSDSSASSTTPAHIDAPERVSRSESLRVHWTGPGGQWDYVTLISEDAAEGEYGYYVYIREGNPLIFQAPTETGSFELRYVDGMTQRTLARHSLTVD